MLTNTFSCGRQTRTTNFGLWAQYVTITLIRHIRWRTTCGCSFLLLNMLIKLTSQQEFHFRLIPPLQSRQGSNLSRHVLFLVGLLYHWATGLYVPKARLELASDKALDPKSSVSTSFTTLVFFSNMSKSCFEPPDGLEPPTVWLQIRSSTNWAKGAWRLLLQFLDTSKNRISTKFYTVCKWIDRYRIRTSWISTNWIRRRSWGFIWARSQSNQRGDK